VYVTVRPVGCAVVAGYTIVAGRLSAVYVYPTVLPAPVVSDVRFDALSYVAVLVPEASTSLVRRSSASHVAVTLCVVPSLYVVVVGLLGSVFVVAQ
jgi:hypothetical protein